MAMPAQPTRWTIDMVRALPDDGNRYEVIDGELFVTPAPSWIHQNAVLELALLLTPYLREHALGHVIISPADVVFGPRNAVEPDLFVVPLIEGRPPRSWEEIGRLLLSVEVLSPSTRRTDRGEKRDLYRRKAVPQYWVVDTDARTVERYLPDDSTPKTFSETLEWQPDAAVPPLGVALQTYFDRVNGLVV